jgi:biopolymer transport protein ExbB
VFDVLVKGGPVMIPLGLCSVAAVAILAERLWYLHRVARHTDALLTRLNGVAAPAETSVRAVAESCTVPLARVLLAALSLDGRPSLSAAERQGAEEARRLEGRLPAVEAIVTLAPLLGLLGTITGMIQSFSVLSVSGGENPFAVTGGIAEALITTATGLIIAVVAFAGYAWCQHVMEREVHRMETVTGDLLERLTT